MSDARTMKMREYGTDVLSHDPSVTDSGFNVRANNTFKSSVMDQAPPEFTPQNKAKSRERVFSSRPLVSQVQRASYQDSNIFGYKD
jgi:hypothetical protein